MYSLFLHSHKPEHSTLYIKNGGGNSSGDIIPDAGKHQEGIKGMGNKFTEIVGGLLRRKGDTSVEWEDTIITPDSNLESNNILRKQTVVSIGDLHGNYGAFLGNLTSAGLIDNDKHWIGGNTKVIFHGDIFADRLPHSVDIVSCVILLQQEAKLHGGELIFIAGNHEDVAFAYLTRQPLYYNNKKVSDIGIGSFPSAIPGLMELEHLIDPTITIEKIKYYDIKEQINTIQNRLDLETEVSRKIKLQIRLNTLHENLKEAEENLQGQTIEHDRKNLLNEMRLDPKGREILEFLCTMRLVNQTDDTLRIHVPPHPALLKLVLEKGVDEINTLYQKGLQYYYLNRGELSLFEKIEFLKLRKIFLDTEHREIENNPIYEELFDIGITKIMYGHNASESIKMTDNYGVICIGLDTGYGILPSGKNNEKRNFGGRKNSNMPIFTIDRRNPDRMTSTVITHTDGTLEFGDKSKHTI